MKQKESDTKSDTERETGINKNDYNPPPKYSGLRLDKQAITEITSAQKKVTF